MPGRDELEQLQTEVCSTDDFRKPVNLAQKLLSSPGINKEVGSAMTELLQVCWFLKCIFPAIQRLLNACAPSPSMWIPEKTTCMALSS